MFAMTRQFPLWDGVSMSPLLIPDWSFGSYREARIKSYESTHAEILKSAEDLGIYDFNVWRTRKEKLFWRGVVHANREPYLKWSQASFRENGTNVVDIAESHIK